MTTDELTALRERHTPKMIPPCPVCGRKQKCTRFYGSNIYYCCVTTSRYEDDPYATDPRVLRLLDEREALLTACKMLDQLDWRVGYDLGTEGNYLILDEALTLARAAIAKAEQPAP